MGRPYRQLARVLRLVTELQGQRWCPSIPTLAAHLGVSRRTVLRDLEALRAVGWTVPPFRVPSDGAAE